MSEIDNLEIRVTSSADDATNHINTLASAMDRFKGKANAVKTAAGVIEDSMEHVAASTERGAATSTKAFKRYSVGIKGFANGIKNALLPMGQLAKNALGAVTGLFRSIGRIAFYRSIRALLKDIVQSFKDLYGYSKNVGTGFASSMDKITTSLKYFQNSIAAMVSPLINAIAPVIDVIIDKVVELLNWFNQLFSVLSGADTYTVAKKVAVTWDSTFDKSTKSARKTANEIKRTILGFDEINKLTKPNEASTSGGSGSSPYSDNYKNMFETKKLSSDWKGFANALEKTINDTVSRINLILSGAELALGAILAFSGTNIPLGIALIALGASGMANAIAQNWTGLNSSIVSVIDTIESVLIGASLGVGAVLAFSGINVPLGIGLMAAGIYGAAKGIIWGGALTGGISNVLKRIVALISGAMLAVGTLLAFTGINVPVGIGLMAAGLTGVAASIVWGAQLSFGITKTLNSILVLLSGASMAVGALLAFTGVNVPVGIGLMAVGAAGIAASIAWGDLLTNGIDGVLKEIALLIAGAEVAIGAVLAFSGANVPLGIGLIALGITTGAVAVIWGDGVTTPLMKTLQTIAGIVSGAEIAVGAILALTGVNIPLGIALIASGIGGVAATVDWDALGAKISEAWEKIKENTSQAWEDIKSSVSETWGVLKASATIAFTTIKGKVVTAWENLKINTGVVWGNIKADVENAWDDLKKKAGTAFTNIKNKVKDAWDRSVEWTNDKWESIKGTVADKWGTMKANATTTFSNIKSKVQTAWDTISTNTSEKWESIKGTATGIWDNLKGNASSTFGDIKDFVTDSWDKVKGALDTFTKWINDTFSGGWENAWNNIVNLFGTIFGGIKEAAKTPINAVIGFVNMLIGKVETAVNRIRRGISNTIKIDIQPVDLGIFGTTPRIYWKPLDLQDVTFNRIHELAKGGILNSAAMIAPNVMAGEAGREAVLPLENNTEWMDMLANRIYDINQDRANSTADNGMAIMQAMLNEMRSILAETRRLNDKEFTAEVTSSSVQRAMNRTNRRAGVTVMAVGPT